MDDRQQVEDLATLTTEIVKAHLKTNPVATEELPDFIVNVFNSLAKGSHAEPSPPPVPSVPISNSIQVDHLVCLECGDKVKVLKRHLNGHHSLTVEAYRERWNLPANYPVVPESFSQLRRTQALNTGLGKYDRVHEESSIPTETIG